MTGTAANVSPSLSIRKADCSSFFSTTVTPVVTTTVTQTSTSTSNYVAMTTVTTTVQEGKKRQATTTVTAITKTPTAVPTYASACSGTVRYGSACSCFGVSRVTTTAPTSTSTVTVTVSTTVASTSTTTIVAATATAQPSCNNAGMSWAYYEDPYDPWDPTNIKTRGAGNEGVTYNAHVDTNYGPSGQNGPIYDQSVRQVATYAVQQRGYIYATETGTYTFSTTNVDDNIYMWVGPQAYSGWPTANAQLHTTFDAAAYRGGSASYSMSLVAGTFTAFRIAFHNYGGPGSFDFTVATPNGVQVLSSNSEASISVVQYSCDGTSAPAYAPFGQET